MKNKEVRFVLRGGIGNQLFQVAAAIFFAKETNLKTVLVNQGTPLLNLRQITDVSNLTEDSFYLRSMTFSPLRLLGAQAGKIFRGLGNHIGDLHPFISVSVRQYRSTTVGYDPRLTEITPGTIVLGYFQTWRYFTAVRDQLPGRAFEPADPSNWYKTMLERINSTDILAIHVRQGDYAKVDEIGVLPLGYYSKALKLLKSSGSDWEEVWVFSDEPDAARKLLEQELAGTIAHYVEAPLESPDFESLLLMSNARQLITANSTFSYWAAILGRPGKRVVYPDPWFRAMDNPADLCPPEWIPVESPWEAG